jgi:hypothetical protein
MKSWRAALAVPDWKRVCGSGRAVPLCSPCRWTAAVWRRGVVAHQRLAEGVAVVFRGFIARSVDGGRRTRWPGDSESSGQRGCARAACVVCVPLKWALVVHVELPELPEADVASFLQIEAERGFPCDIATLRLATSRWRRRPESSTRR